MVRHAALTAGLFAASIVLTGPAGASSAPLVAAADAGPIHHRHRRHASGGYEVNRQGFGNYVRGANGSFGGYPAGSAGAQELQMNQRYKCQAVPESC